MTSDKVPNTLLWKDMILVNAYDPNNIFDYTLWRVLNSMDENYMSAREISTIKYLPKKVDIKQILRSFQTTVTQLNERAGASDNIHPINLPAFMENYREEIKNSFIDRNDYGFGRVISLSRSMRSFRAEDLVSAQISLITEAGLRAVMEDFLISLAQGNWQKAKQ